MTHRPTAASRKLIKEAATHGLSRRKMALLLKVSFRTLIKHYDQIIMVAENVADYAVVSNLFNIASTSRSAQGVTAAIWWTKARMGWKDSPTEINLTHAFEQGAEQFDEKINAMLQKALDADPDTSENPGTSAAPASSPDEGLDR